MNAGRLLLLPGGGTLGSIDRARLRPPGSRPRGRREGSALQAGRLLFRHELPRGKVQTLSRREGAQASGEWRKPPTVTAEAVIPELDRDRPHLDRDRSKLWREKSPGEHRPGVVIPAGTTRSRERTPGGSKASKRACRSFTASSAGRGNDRRLGKVVRCENRNAHAPGGWSRAAARKGPDSGRRNPGGASRRRSHVLRDGRRQGDEPAR